jgi:hypothetical protein
MGASPDSLAEILYEVPGKLVANMARGCKKTPSLEQYVPLKMFSPLLGRGTPTLQPRVLLPHCSRGRDCLDSTP